MKKKTLVDNFWLKGRTIAYGIFDNVKSAIINNKKKLNNLGKTNLELGIYHINRGNLIDAKLRFKIMIYFNSYPEDAHYQLARCYQYMYDFDQAIINFLSCHNNVNSKFRLNMIQNQQFDFVPIAIVEEDSNYMASNYINNEVSIFCNNLIIDYLSSLFANIENKKIIDLGCGVGNFGRLAYTKLQPRSLVGVEISSQMITYLQQNDEKQIYTKLIKQDIVTLSPKNKFDIIIACNLNCYTKFIDKQIEVMLDITAENGIVLIVLKIDSSTSETYFDYSSNSFCFGLDHIEKIIKKIKASKIIVKKTIMSTDQHFILLAIIK